VRHAIIADVHANTIALRAALAELETLRIDAIHCLGDVVGYHSQPREAIALLRQADIDCVAGNHDVMALTDDPPGGGPLARAAMEWTRRTLDSADLAWLAALPMERRIGSEALLVHSVPWSADQRLRVGGDFAAAAKELSLSHPWVRICFTGHTHVAGFAHLAPDGSVTIGGPTMITLEDSPAIWFVNPGSIGLPRDGSPGARYAIYDDAAGTISFHCAKYDMEAMNLANQMSGLATRVPETSRHAQPTPVEGLEILRWLSAS
jgi:predicted phosphodiesterase